jgi:hypothetical protein
VDIPDQQAEGGHADQDEDECGEEFRRGGDDGEGLGGEDSGEEIDAAHLFGCGVSWGFVRIGKGVGGRLEMWKFWGRKRYEVLRSPECSNSRVLRLSILYNSLEEVVQRADD